MIDPITREEFLLAKALGENVPDIVPVIRKEMYLAKIAGADIQTPEAITREEMYLDAIANGTEVNIEPITRKEMFYAKALGLIENAPEPITRIEGLLNQITVGGGGGSYDKYSWEGVFASIDKGTYATDYAIGDTVPLDLGSEGLINMQIAAFDTDDLADGSGKAPITWMACDDPATKVRYNPAYESGVEGTGNIGGWEKSELRSHMNTTLFALIPDFVRNHIQAVTKKQMDNSTSVSQSTADKVWIPSHTEIKESCRVLSAYNKEKDVAYPPSVAYNFKAETTGLYRVWSRTQIKSTANASVMHYTGNVKEPDIGTEPAEKPYYIRLCFCT